MVWWQYVLLIVGSIEIVVPVVILLWVAWHDGFDGRFF
jgi:hypothetical protein